MRLRHLFRDHDGRMSAIKWWCYTTVFTLACHKQSLCLFLFGRVTFRKSCTPRDVDKRGPLPDGGLYLTIKNFFRRLFRQPPDPGI